MYNLLFFGRKGNRLSLDISDICVRELIKINRQTNFFLEAQVIKALVNPLLCETLNTERRV